MIFCWLNNVWHICETASLGDPGCLQCSVSLPLLNAGLTSKHHYTQQAPWLFRGLPGKLSTFQCKKSRCNPSTGEGRGLRTRVKVILYRWSSRPFWVTWDPISKKKKLINKQGWRDGSAFTAFAKFSSKHPNQAATTAYNSSSLKAPYHMCTFPQTDAHTYTQ